MHTSKNRLAAALTCGLILTGMLSPAFANHVDPVQTPQPPAAPFVLDADGYERVEFVTDNYTRIDSFTVTEGGTYRLSLTDMLFPGALRKLGVAVTTAEDKLVDLFGSGNALFDMQPGMYYLSVYAKPFGDEPGLFGLSLQMQGDVAPVPAPAGVWLLGSGLFGLVGWARRRTVPLSFGPR